MKKSLLYAITLVSGVLLTRITANAQTPIFAPSMTITSFGSVNSPTGEAVDKIIDGLGTTKYLDLNPTDGMGFTVDLGGTPAVARILEMATANDFPGRDPMDFEVLGSNNGTTFISIATGTIPCITTRFNTRSFNFINSTAYLYYRVNYTNRCTSTENSIQVAETQLFSIVCGVPIVSSQTLVECSGFSISVGTNTYNSTGVYVDIIPAANGCDSTVTTHLTIINSPIVNATPVFECDSAQINGNWYYTSQTITDVYANAAFNGCDSTIITPLTISNLTGSLTSDICPEENIIINGNTYNSANPTGIEVFSNIGPNGCDSTVTINLNVVMTTIDLTLINTSPTLAANQTGGTYQWINCDNNNFIAGETSRDYTATTSGNYAVIITLGGCSDTTECINVSFVGINENSFGADMTLYPNPTTGNVNLNFGQTLNGGTIIICNIMGKQVYRLENLNRQLLNIDINDFNKGVYFVKIQKGNQQKRLKLIKR